jgi:hypothetical protein
VPKAAPLAAADASMCLRVRRKITMISLVIVVIMPANASMTVESDRKRW